MLLECFSLAEWRRAREVMREHPQALTRLTRKCRKLATALRLDFVRALAEFEEAVNVLMDERSAGDDNRDAWAYVLTQEYQTTLESELTALPYMVRFYLSVADGTCDIERGLGTLTGLLAVHNGPLLADGMTMWTLLEVMLDGPQREEELFQRPDLSDDVGRELAAAAPGNLRVTNDMLLFTDISRSCAQLWVQFHGRRFGVYRKRSDAGATKTPKGGSEAAVARRTRQGRTSLVTQAAGDGPCEETLLEGVSRRSLVQKRTLNMNECWNTKLDKFHQHTRKKNVQKRAVEQARATGGNPYPTGHTRTGGLRQQPRACPRLQRRRRIVHWPPVDIFPNAGPYEVLPTSQVSDVARAHVVITPDHRLLQEPDPDSIRVALLVVGLGKGVLVSRAWTPAAGLSAAVQHVPAALTSRATIGTTEDFRRKHPKLMNALRACASAQGSRWRVSDDNPTVTLASIKDAAVFVQSMRRVASRGMGGSYVA